MDILGYLLGVLNSPIVFMAGVMLVFTPRNRNGKPVDLATRLREGLIALVSLVAIVELLLFSIVVGN